MSASLFSDDDRAFMRRALGRGMAQMGRTWPNPSVGCVIVRDGQVIAEGATGDGGRPHAEETALDSIGNAAAGATAYVTLEPCGERSNGGCSCSQRLAEAGVKRVVYACDDPSPFASHKGPRRLIGGGIAVEPGLMSSEARVLIAGFVHWLETGRPRVAESDGRHVDAMFEVAPDTVLARELEAWGQRGYRSLGVVPHSPLADALRAQGLLSES